MYDIGGESILEYFQKPPGVVPASVNNNPTNLIWGENCYFCGQHYDYCSCPSHYPKRKDIQEEIENESEEVKESIPFRRK